jgi:hypothetical protein
MIRQPHDPRRQALPQSSRGKPPHPAWGYVPRTSGSGEKAIDQCARSIVPRSQGQRDPASLSTPHPRVRHPSAPEQKASEQPGSRCLEAHSGWRLSVRCPTELTRLCDQLQYASQQDMGRSQSAGSFARYAAFCIRWLESEPLQLSVVRFFETSLSGCLMCPRGMKGK